MPALLASDSAVASSYLFAKLETEDNNVGWSSQVRTRGAEQEQIGDHWIPAAYLDQPTPHSGPTPADFTPDSASPVRRQVLAIGRRSVFRLKTAWDSIKSRPPQSPTRFPGSWAPCCSFLAPELR